MTINNKDSFGIREQKNQRKKGRNIVVNKDGDFSLGEKSPYSEWIEERGGNDPLDLDKFDGDMLPWTTVDKSETVQSQWDSLKALYPGLKGRQKQVVDMLFEGHTNQSLIAVQLGMKPYDVNKILKVVAKKISKNIP